MLHFSHIRILQFQFSPIVLLRSLWLDAIVTHHILPYKILSPRNPHYLLTYTCNLTYNSEYSHSLHSSFTCSLVHIPLYRMQISKITTASSTLSRSLPSEFGKLQSPKFLEVHALRVLESGYLTDTSEWKVEGLSNLCHKSHPWR